MHALGPEHTGSTLIELVVELLGLEDLAQADVLDIGCGVRFTQAIINREIPVKSYTGIDVHRPLIEYLQREVQDPRFRFAHWNVRNEKYAQEGERMTRQSRLPVGGEFDVIWLFSVFTHLGPTDADAMLAILRRHVRASGALFFSAFVDDAIESFEDRCPDRPLDYPCYSERYLRRLVEGNGWRVASVNQPDPSRYIQHHWLCHPSVGA